MSSILYIFDPDSETVHSRRSRRRWSSPIALLRCRSETKRALSSAVGRLYNACMPNFESPNASKPFNPWPETEKQLAGPDLVQSSALRSIEDICTLIASEDVAGSGLRIRFVLERV